MINLYVALIHHPVVNRNGSIVASAITNLDLHDIARASRTYGVRAFFVVTPLADQQALAERLVAYWVDGKGAAYNPKRCEALNLVSIRPSLEEAVDDIARECGMTPCRVATSARSGFQNIGYSDFRKGLMRGRPYLLMFGTAWGLPDVLLSSADHVLDPIQGDGGYNHLSVRSAAAITLDRLLGNRTMAPGDQ